MTSWYFLNDLGYWVPCSPKLAAELMTCPRGYDAGAWWPQVRLADPHEVAVAVAAGEGER